VFKIEYRAYYQICNRNAEKQQEWHCDFKGKRFSLKAIALLNE